MRRAIAAAIPLAALAACDAPAPSTPPPAALPAVEAPAATVPALPRLDGEPDPRLVRSFYIVLDGSGSMAERGCAGGHGSKLAAATSVLASVVAADAFEPDAHVALAVFDAAGRRELVPLGPRSHRDVVAALQGVTAGGGTPLGHAVSKAMHVLLGQRALQMGYGEQHLVIVTDGAADDEPVLARALERCRREGLLVHAIGFCITPSSSLASTVFSRHTADDPEALRAALRATAAEAEGFEPLRFE